MKKLIFFAIFLAFFANAQDVFESNANSKSADEIHSYRYVSLSDNKVYDIEIIIFAYLNPLPNIDTYSNKTVYSEKDAIQLELKPENLPYTQIQNTPDKLSELTDKGVVKNTRDYTIPIEDDNNNIEVLTWFELSTEKYKLLPIWQRLEQQANIIPLIHKAWRQTETPFDNPIFVKVDNYYNEPVQTADELPESNSSLFPDSRFNSSFPGFSSPTGIEIIKNTATPESYGIYTNQSLNYGTDNFIPVANKIYSDFTVKGKVALSQGRFMHFQNQLNLFRLQNKSADDTIRNMIFSLEERRQVKPDNLYYFDSPWFGSIIKISEYKGEEPEPADNKEESQTISSEALPSSN